MLKSGNKYEMKQNDCEFQLKIHDLTNHDSGIYKCCTGGIVTTASLEVKGMCSTFKDHHVRKKSLSLNPKFTLTFTEFGRGL